MIRTWAEKELSELPDGTILRSGATNEIFKKIGDVLERVNYSPYWEDRYTFRKVQKRWEVVEMPAEEELWV